MDGRPPKLMRTTSLKRAVTFVRNPARFLRNRGQLRQEEEKQRLEKLDTVRIARMRTWEFDESPPGSRRHDASRTMPRSRVDKDLLSRELDAAYAAQKATEWYWDGYEKPTRIAKFV